MELTMKIDVTNDEAIRKMCALINDNQGTHQIEISFNGRYIELLMIERTLEVQTR